jgi:hypothetical protein
VGGRQLLDSEDRGGEGDLGEEGRLLSRLRLVASEVRSHLLMSFGRSGDGILPRLCNYTILHHCLSGVYCSVY